MRKSLSSFQVSDDRGDPVSVLIKPLHSAIIPELVKGVREESQPANIIMVFFVFFLLFFLLA
jgi:hypothetical protein